MKRVAVIAVAGALQITTVTVRAGELPPVGKVGTELPTPGSGKPSETVKPDPTAKEILTDAAIVAIMIAASIAAYKASGRPCACPEDTMRNGRRCGGNSAYAKPGGARPLCYPRDITAEMIDKYRKNSAAR